MTYERAIIEGDVPRLSAVPGVGRRTAERIILELREKLAKGKSDPVGDFVPLEAWPSGGRRRRSRPAKPWLPTRGGGAHHTTGPSSGRLRLGTCLEGTHSRGVTHPRQEKGD